MFKTNKSLRFRSERAVNYERRGNLETPYKGLSLVIHDERVMKGKEVTTKVESPRERARPAQGSWKSRLEEDNIVQFRTSEDGQQKINVI